MKKVNKSEVTKPEERKARRTLKRCHLCQKMFDLQKYGDHFSVCYALINQKNEESKTKSTMKNPRLVRKQIRASVTKTNTLKINNLESDNRFRIKQVSGTNQFLKKKQLGDDRKKLQNKRQIQIDKKSQNKRQQQFQRLQTSKKEGVSRKIQKQKNQASQPNNSEVSIKDLSNNPEDSHQKEQNNQMNGIYMNQSEFIRNTDQRKRQESEIEGQPFQQTILQSQRDSRQGFYPERQQTLFSATNEVLGIPVSEQYNIQDLIRSTSQIIRFVNDMNIRGEDETLNIMVAQLEQLNQIAEQITTLNQLGRALAIRMVNIFASRIHQLQTTIITQIGIALMRGFNERIGPQLQNLMYSHPDLKTGFSQSQIDHIFQEKISMTQKQCSICLAEISKSEIVLQLQCCHIFHPDCIKQWLSTSKKCPLCRKIQQHEK